MAPKGRSSLPPDDPLARACESITIFDAWKRLNLPGQAGRSRHTPWRADKNKSFSIFSNGRRWKDHATGEAGNLVTFLEKAVPCSRAQAAEMLKGWAGIEKSNFTPAKTRRKVAARVSPEVRPEKAIAPSYSIRSHTTIDIQKLSQLRGISQDALLLALERGILGFEGIGDATHWILHERGIAAHKRPLHKPLSGANKSRAIKGSNAKWPIGLKSSKKYPAIALVEGGPDLLSAFHLALNSGSVDYIAPVMMPGAHPIDHAALVYFKGKQVRIFPHRDANRTGEKAAEKWARQLHSHAASIDAVPLPACYTTHGVPAKDLNDILHLGTGGDNDLCFGSMVEAFSFHPDKGWKLDGLGEKATVDVLMPYSCKLSDKPRAPGESRLKRPNKPMIKKPAPLVPEKSDKTPVGVEWQFRAVADFYQRNKNRKPIQPTSIAVFVGLLRIMNLKGKAGKIRVGQMLKEEKGSMKAITGLIGEYAGVTEETVTKALTALHDAGVIYRGYEDTMGKGRVWEYKIL